MATRVDSTSTLQDLLPTNVVSVTHEGRGSSGLPGDLVCGTCTKSSSCPWLPSLDSSSVRCPTCSLPTANAAAAAGTNPNRATPWLRSPAPPPFCAAEAIASSTVTASRRGSCCHCLFKPAVWPRAWTKSVKEAQSQSTTRTTAAAVPYGAMESGRCGMHVAVC